MPDDNENITVEIEAREQSDFWFACVDLAVIRDGILSPCDKAVYAAICARVDVNTRSCPLKVKTIAGDANCSVRSTQESIKALVARGVLERVDRFKDSRQLACSYRIIGHRAACYREIEASVPEEAPDDRGADFAPPCESCTPTGADSAPRVLEPGSYEKKDTPTGRTEEPVPPVDISEIPTAMRQVVKFFLHETGRLGVSPSELPAIRALERIHYPARINQEIETALRRFGNDGRAPDMLTFDYLYESLRHQPGRGKKTPRAAPKKNSAEDERKRQMAEFERQEREEIMRRYGGETA